MSAAEVGHVSSRPPVFRRTVGQPISNLRPDQSAPEVCLVTSEIIETATAVPPPRMGKSPFAAGECWITKTRAMIEIAQIPALTIASVIRLRAMLL